MEDTHFEIPSLIPPLPASSAPCNKENQEQPRAKPIQNQSPGILRSKVQVPVLGARTPLGTRSDGTKQGTPVGQIQSHDAPSPSYLHSTSAHKKRVVLRYGETAETLFCIGAQSSEEQIGLARGIIDGPLADDPAAWHRVLELASTTNASGSDLTRLHRRATLRFAADLLKTENYQHVLSIWLSFAQLHARLGATDEARRTFRHIENQKMKLDASFYLSLANFEKAHDPDKYKAVLIRGVKEKAEPIKLLEEELEKCTNDRKSHSRVIPPLQPRPRPQSPLRRGSSEFETSPKRRKLDGGNAGPRIGLGEDFSRGQSKQPATRLDQMNRDPSQSASFNPGIGADQINAKPPTSLSKNRPNIVMKCSGFATMAKQPAPVPRQKKLLSSRLGRKGLTGKAKRVDPGDSFVQHSDSEEDETTNDHSIQNTTSNVHPAHPIAPSSKIKKLDLGYMWEWDPNARGKKNPYPTTEKSEGDGSTSSAQSSEGTQGSSTCISHETQKTESNRTIDEKNAASSQKKAVQKHESNRTFDEKDVTGSQNKNKETRKSTPNGQELSDSTRKARSKIDQLMAGANVEFLPLVHETNILRVNGTSYAKLGVIGKGGSCKVYRALSKKCNVVAIKKVKIDGMDRKAIEGYANEISLLKRLKGNPAIIQMHDSQVDLERKFILLVMELGEVDLNHVLQQRALSGASRSLNMNFIRLTWQQMLSAVHCIHEERIIHSDLKPANFLFVRGALKLIDFGIAKAIQSEDTTNIYRESHIGTLNYMSPEAILDTGSGNNGPRMKIGRASDVWSLGCILYEMVYGRTPFASLHFIQKLQAIVNNSHQIDFPEEADDAVLDAMKLCLRRNPEERPPIMGRGGLLNEHRFLHSGKPSRR